MCVSITECIAWFMCVCHAGVAASHGLTVHDLLLSSPKLMEWCGRNVAAMDKLLGMRTQLHVHLSISNAVVLTLHDTHDSINADTHDTII